MAGSEAIVGNIERGNDLALRVRRIAIDGEEFLDVREYIPSTATYGRGIMVPADLKKPLLAALKEA